MNTIVSLIILLIVHIFYPNLNKGEAIIREDLQEPVVIQDVVLSISLNKNDRYDYIRRELDAYDYKTSDFEGLTYYKAGNRYTYFNNKYVVDFFLPTDQEELLPTIENQIKEWNLNE